jgi:uncharacterized membrane protein
MNTNLFDSGRLSAFSDGVIAIVITVMLLELRLPSGSHFSDLVPLLPTFSTYILSFVYLAIYWNNHHHLLAAAKGVNGNIMWANMGLLFCLTLIPIATSWMGSNYAAVDPTVTYGIVLLLNSLAYIVLQRCIIRTLDKDASLVRSIGIDSKGKLSEALYALGILLALFSPLLAQCLYVIVAIIWVVPDRRVERALTQ